MKRSLLLSSALLIVMATVVNAQGVKFGVKGGLNISSLSDYEHFISEHEDAELDNKAGVYAGVFTQIYFTTHFGIETGLFYSMLGGQDKENDHYEHYKVTANPSYLQIPVTAIYKFNLPAGFSIYPSVGVYGGYGLSGKIKTGGTIGSIDILPGTIDYFDVFARKFDFGATAGLNIGYRKFVLGTAYDRGLIRVNKDKIPYDDNAFNSNFRITLGYIF